MDEGLEFLRNTIDLVKSIETRFLELGSRLYRIKEERLWEKQYDSFFDFLEVARISPSMATMLTKVHQYYVVEGKQKFDSLKKIGYSNLYQAIPLIERDGIKGAVVKAETLTRAEIIEEVKEKKYGEHDHVVGEERWGVCSTCGKFVKINQ